MTDKGGVLAFPNTAAIEAEAAAWVARFDAGNVSARDHVAFQEWLNRSALHREIIAEYGNLWSAFDALGSLTDTGKAGQETGTHNSRPAILEKAVPWLAACAVVAIAITGGAVVFRPSAHQFPTKVEPPLPTRLSYETTVGSQKRIALADGTLVILNTNSLLDVDFSGQHRDVHLVRGEAYFNVVHNKARPFTVYANGYAVRDLGTAFDVHLSKTGQVEVGVTKGRVEVAHANSTHAFSTVKDPSVVVAGHSIVLGQKIEHPEAVPSTDMGRKLAWRQGELIYTGQPLGEVLADISRYSNITIDLADPALKDLPVGGAFRTDQIDAIFAALENNFDIHAEWISPQHVRLTSGRKTPLLRD